jgi:hypothetical protein
LRDKFPYLASKGVSMRERLSGVESYDFLLVTTYVPVISLCVRAIGFIFLINWLALKLWLPWHVVVVFTASVVYVDAWTMASHSLDRTCGYLCVCALAVLAQPHAAGKSACTEGASLFLWCENFIWSFLSTFEVISCVSGMRVVVPSIAKVLLGSVLALLHAWGACAHPGVLEMMCRAVVFYVMCAIALMCLKFTHVRENERKNYMTMIPHAYTHVLFVHLYAMLASVIFVLSVYVRLVVQSMQGAPSADIEQAQTHTAKRVDVTHVKRTADKRHESGSSREEREEHSELLRKLVAAKAASGLS